MYVRQQDCARPPEQRFTFDCHVTAVPSQQGEEDSVAVGFDNVFTQLQQVPGPHGTLLMRCQVSWLGGMPLVPLSHNLGAMAVQHLRR